MGGQEGAVKEGLATSIFYADDGLVASKESAHLQGAFDSLTGLFNQVGLQTN